MSVNLEKNKESINAAWRDVLDDKTDTNWALFGYEGMTNDLKVVSTGDGGLTELIDDFNSGKIQYAFIKMDLPDGTVSKYVFINWQGEGAPTVRKSTCAKHVTTVANLFGAHLTAHARTEDDLDEKALLAKLARAGEPFNFRTARSEELPPSGPVGTAYKKVNPVQEINSSERDQFWMKEELEEKRRVEAERARREKERKKAEEDVRKRDEVEAAKRAQALQEHPSSLSPDRRAEARALIVGPTVAAARAMFQRDLAQGQVGRNSSVPEKPVRSSVIAQRINAFSQQTENNTSQRSEPIKSPKSELSPQTEQTEPKTSPLKNIDKIKMSLESPSQIQYEPILDPSSDLSPSTEELPSFSSVNYDNDKYRDMKQSEPMIKQNILENDMFDASYGSGTECEDDDSDNKFSTIKRSPYSKNTDEGSKGEVTRQDTVIENSHYGMDSNGGNNDDSPTEGVIYEDLDSDPGLTAQALYDYQAADATEISFDPGDVITHIAQVDAGWWQGLTSAGSYGLFPANYVRLL